MTTDSIMFIMCGAAVLTLVGVIVVAIIDAVKKKKYCKLTIEVKESLGLTDWKYINYDDTVELKSSRAVENYEPVQYFKDNRDRLSYVSNILSEKKEYENTMRTFLEKNQFMDRLMYDKVEMDIQNNLKEIDTFNLQVLYISPAGRSRNRKIINFTEEYINELIADPTVLMSKTEFNQYVKNMNKEILNQKHHEYYERVNSIIDLANGFRDQIVIQGDVDELDRLISSLFDRTVNSIKKVKNIDSDEWAVLNNYISKIEKDVNAIIENNKRILDYYESEDFKLIKKTCSELMDSQKDFNEYINEKAQSISKLFGTKVVRNETVVDDEYNYIRPYKKTITPFTAEVSAAVFASAENSPIEYVVKNFYPNKSQYPEQIQKLQFLIEELETLREAKQIIDNYKKDYQQYITTVPDYVMENDENGFYTRLGFADISENVLTVEYRFSYTSGGGMAQRYFTVPMTEDTIIELINTLQSKLTLSAFAKDQRSLMTAKLRQEIKERDNYTCKLCGNSTHQEPNLLLEIDHIIPVSKGGCTISDNLQTLCWKCNRSKSNKLTTPSA